MLELLDQVEDAIGVDNDTVCDKTTHSCNSQDGIADGLPVRANHLVERTKSHIPKEVVSVFSDSSYLVLEVCFWNQALYHWFFGAQKKNSVRLLLFTFLLQVSEKSQPAAKGPYKV